MAISMRIESVSKTIAPKSICIVVSIRISLCFTFGNMNSSSRVGNISSSTCIGTMNSWDSSRSDAMNTNSVSNIGDSMTNTMTKMSSISKMTHSIGGIESIGLSLTLGNM